MRIGLVELLLILLIVYRNPVTMMLPLITIGVSLSIAQSTVAAQCGWQFSAIHFISGFAASTTPPTVCTLSC